MIQNKQVSIWRGSQEPPTIYHLWFKNEAELLRYDEQQAKWVIFLDGSNLDNKITEFLDMLANITINGQPISDSPELTGQDIKINIEGNYINRDNTVASALARLDALMTTKVYGQ